MYVMATQLHIWQENSAATVIPPSEAAFILRTLKKRRLQRRVLQARFLFVDTTESKSTVQVTASVRTVVPGYADRDLLEIRSDLPTACRDSPTACHESIIVLLTISASRSGEKLGAHDS